MAADPLRGLFPMTIDGKRCVVEYEPDSDLRDTETVPLKEPGGIEAFIRREVLPHAPDAWIDEAKTTIGYEISFTRYFYKPQPLAPAGGDPRRYPGAGTRNRWTDGGYHRSGSMIDGLRPYPETKPTGLPWLGDIPAHWDAAAREAHFEADGNSGSARRRYRNLLS